MLCSRVQILSKHSYKIHLPTLPTLSRLETHVMDESSASISQRPGLKYSLASSARKYQSHGLTNFRMKKALINAGVEAEEYLGKNIFSIDSSVGEVLENFKEIISLVTFRNSHQNHPLVFLRLLLEAETNYKREGGTNPFPLWRGMMVLLATRIFGCSDKIKAAPPEIQNLTLDRQIRLAKIAESAYLTQQIHRRIVDSKEILEMAATQNDKWKFMAELNNANKTAVLAGDLLWAQICAHMAALRSQSVSEHICKSLMDYCESEFILQKKGITKQQCSVDSWFRKTQLSIGSVMGAVMSSTLLFNDLTEHDRVAGYKLGVMLGLTYQAYMDIIFFEELEVQLPDSWIDTGLLPLVHKIKIDPNLLYELPPSKVYEAVRSDSSVMEESMYTLQILQEDTMTFINEIPRNNTFASDKARQILLQFVCSLSP